MKPSDTLPTPLDQKPATKLTELGRQSAGEGFETVTYQGEDGYRYEATVKDNVIASAVATASSGRNLIRQTLQCCQACVELSILKFGKCFPQTFAVLTGFLDHLV